MWQIFLPHTGSASSSSRNICTNSFDAMEDFRFKKLKVKIDPHCRPDTKIAEISRLTAVIDGSVKVDTNSYASRDAERPQLPPASSSTTRIIFVTCPRPLINCIICGCAFSLITCLKILVDFRNAQQNHLVFCGITRWRAVFQIFAACCYRNLHSLFLLC